MSQTNPVRLKVIAYLVAALVTVFNGLYALEVLYGPNFISGLLGGQPPVQPALDGPQVKRAQSPTTQVTRGAGPSDEDSRNDQSVALCACPVTVEETNSPSAQPLQTSPSPTSVAPPAARSVALRAVPQPPTPGAKSPVSVSRPTTNVQPAATGLPATAAASTGSAQPVGAAKSLPSTTTAEVSPAAPAADTSKPSQTPTPK